MPTQESVLEALKAVIDPDLHRDIVTLGFVKEVRIEGADVYALVQLTTPACPVKEELQAQCVEAIQGVEGVRKVTVEMTAEVRQRHEQELVPEVKHVIAVASGKGGVGKSTVTVNLAVALAAAGAKVGIMDADVYGPSIPMMVGAEHERPNVTGSKILPILRHGVSVMSLGFLMEEGQAVMWRGPMVAGTVRQLLADVDWGDLDYLLVDLPPGTGDAPMSLAQLVPLTGVVIVATPHNVAANIAGKSVALFRRLNSPVLGVVENMAEMTLPNGETLRIFAGLSGEKLAAQLKVPYLGSIPLDPEVSACGDAGTPAVLAHPDSPQAQAFRSIAGKLAQQASILSLTRTDLTQMGEAAERPRFEPVKPLNR
jgi:ATP-binding protein involved in chromosome partitioning